LDHLLAGFAIELLEEVDRCLQCRLATLGLGDAVVETPHIVDDALSLRAHLFSRGVDADLGELDAQPDLVQLRQRLRDTEVADESKT
jgi:hypothetical protein